MQTKESIDCKIIGQTQKLIAPANEPQKMSKNIGAIKVQAKQPNLFNSKEPLVYVRGDLSREAIEARESRPPSFRVDDVYRVRESDDEVPSGTASQCRELVLIDERKQKQRLRDERKREKKRAEKEGYANRGIKRDDEGYDTVEPSE